MDLGDGDDVGFCLLVPGFFGVLGSARVVLPLVSGGNSCTPVIPFAGDDGGDSMVALDASWSLQVSSLDSL